MGEILPDIHCIQSLFEGRMLASYLLVGDQALLIDSGLAYTPQDKILPYLEDLHVPVERISWLVVTHASGDHFGGNSAIKLFSPGTIIVAHQLDAASIACHATFIAEHITALGEDDIPVPDLKGDDPDFLALYGYETAVDWIVHGGEELKLCREWSVKLFHTPGHTPGHLMVYDPRNRALFIGDAIMGEGIPDITGRLVMPPHYFEVDQYLYSIELAYRLGPEHLLATHYPPISGREVVAFLEASKAFVVKFEALLIDLLRCENRSMDIPSIIPLVQERLGIPDSDYQYGLLVRAHLRNLVRARRATVVHEHNKPRWVFDS
jgi:glyoxylase-like metal-dependent hydrolase (beta-lactamase superfamily II)